MSSSILKLSKLSKCEHRDVTARKSKRAHFLASPRSCVSQTIRLSFQQQRRSQSVAKTISDMISYYIHPLEDGQRRVSRKYHNARKHRDELHHVAWLDAPGYWDETKWNLHYDGCDYLRDTMQDCIDYLIELDAFGLDERQNYRRAEAEITFTIKPYQEPTR